MSELRELVSAYGNARAGLALHNGEAQRASCDVRYSAVLDAEAALLARAEAAEALVERLRAALADDPAWIRALGEHGPQIVVESEEAMSARWPHDPGFVTNLAEVMRVYADAMAQRCEQRNEVLLAASGEAEPAPKGATE